MSPIKFRRLIEESSKIEAAKKIDDTVEDDIQADAVIWDHVLRCLRDQNYNGAGVILFGDAIFNPRPRSVQRIWNAIQDNALILLQGAGGVGKTLTPVCWLLLDWLLDPEFTNVKLISATKGHASSNAYSDIVRMHRNSIIKLPGEPTSDYIGLDNKEKKSGISIIAIPEGSDGKGRLQGFHPHPRPKPHPQLGNSSRVRIYMDECEKIPIGVWQGIDNVKVSLSGTDTIKIIGSYNPHDPTTMTARNAEPFGGWDMFDVERGVMGSNDWISKEGWHVCRIDGKYTENVETKKLVYPGLITYEGYRNLELSGGGNSVDHFTFGRGAYPPEGAVGVIISQKIFQESKGEFQFIGQTVKIAGVDVAVDGRDNCIMSVGRTGTASAFKPTKGDLIRFEGPRKVAQLDQQFALRKGDTKIVGDAIMESSISLGVSPEYVCIDATGNGSAVFSYLKAIWSMGVQGIDFNKAATNIRILMEDQFLPEEIYDGIVSEVWFALAKWMEFHFYATSPGVRRDPLEAEMTTRRYVIGAGRKLKVEKKDDYKLRLNVPSPDCFVSGTLVSTVSGNTAIEKIKEGDLILTPFGYSAVAFVHRTFTEETKTVQFSDGSNLQGKSKHGVFVHGLGWARLDSLSINNECESVLSQPLWHILDLLFTREENTSFKALADTTKTDARKQRRDYFTESSGLSTMELFLKVCISITRTAIGQITRLRIWNWLSRPHTREDTCSTRCGITPNSENAPLSDWKKQERLQKHGISLQRDLSGTASTPLNPSASDHWLPKSAFIAEESFDAEELKSQNSAIRDVRKKQPRFAELLGLAWSAVKSLIRASIKTSKPAPESALHISHTKPVEVFNLTLEAENAYYANGILVQNCADSLTCMVHAARIRAKVMGRMTDKTPEKVPPKKPRHGIVDVPKWFVDSGV